ncbi:hypothetical protein [Planococcus halocryophilus]|uniref:hypothetical protein n=1 Tax=Planococcus halocryophilus TaxID=1215089 RepID=UPI001F10F91E|nr:hypothetical protein [Planococcus halocryophilus]MCH4826732.1 hypothetical protein [Planococcus halocryophilus]
MFEEMKARYLILYSVIGTVVSMVTLVLLNVSVIAFEVVSQLVMYVVVPGIYFGYYFKKHNASIWNVLSFTGTKKWLPTLFALVAVSIAFSLSMFGFSCMCWHRLLRGLSTFC